MKATNQRTRRTVATLASLGMAASMATSSLAVASEAPDTSSAGIPDAKERVSEVQAPSKLVEASAEGTFAYDQTTVTPNEDIRKVQGSSAVLCGAREASSYANPLAWEIAVSGDVENAFSAPVEELVGEESVNQLMTCSCGGNPANGRAIVTAGVKGIPVEYLLARAGAEATANTVTFVGADGTRVAMPIGYVLGRHAVVSCEINGENLEQSVGGANQLWMAKTPGNYFVRDVVEIVVSTEDEANVPAAPGSEDEHPNSPNAGILAASVA
ncbi:MAG: molybdopterin-dependent oxidoreductase [Coriobacteriia bacterium]|nr:molybdopterin-dependent oxidoreductase [Coriobacteriia bacterium]MBS5478582.1 molybdopterin-dependent oxidoreductase [Coriobacteriia bacterium]